LALENLGFFDWERKAKYTSSMLKKKESETFLGGCLLQYQYNLSKGKLNYLVVYFQLSQWSWPVQLNWQHWLFLRTPCGHLSLSDLWHP